ncbi:MAG: hypothetical protein IPM39_00085 [Chloroflexi bacterium]|nr:hypothetical protein [Chloroflexota bacterium]
MKSSTSALRGLVLVLLMVVLVLLSLFWFLYRGWGPLEQQAQQANARATRVVGLEEELRQKDDALTAVQATGTAVALERDTAIVNHQIAESETIAQQQANNLLLTRVYTQESVIATLAAPVLSEPQAAIIEPVSGSVVQVGQPITIVVVAADPLGLAQIVVVRGGQAVTQTLAGDSFQVVRLAWTPPGAGEYTVGVTAVNTAQVASQPVSVTVRVENAAPAKPVAEANHQR